MRYSERVRKIPATAKGRRRAHCDTMTMIHKVEFHNLNLSCSRLASLDANINFCRGAGCDLFALQVHSAHGVQLPVQSFHGVIKKPLCSCARTSRYSLVIDGPQGSLPVDEPECQLQRSARLSRPRGCESHLDLGGAHRKLNLQSRHTPREICYGWGLQRMPHRATACLCIMTQQGHLPVECHARIGSAECGDRCPRVLHRPCCACLGCEEEVLRHVPNRKLGEGVSAGRKVEGGRESESVPESICLSVVPSVRQEKSPNPNQEAGGGEEASITSPSWIFWPMSEVWQGLRRLSPHRISPGVRIQWPGMGGWMNGGLRCEVSHQYTVQYCCVSPTCREWHLELCFSEPPFNLRDCKGHILRVK